MRVLGGGVCGVAEHAEGQRRRRFLTARLASSVSLFYCRWCAGGREAERLDEMLRCAKVCVY